MGPMLSPGVCCPILLVWACLLLVTTCAWVTCSQANNSGTGADGDNGSTGTRSAGEPSFDFNYDSADTSPDWPWVSNLQGLELSEATCVARSQQWVEEQMKELRAWESAVTVMRRGEQESESEKSVSAGDQGVSKTGSGAGERESIGSAASDSASDSGNSSVFSSDHAFGAGKQTLRTLLFYLHVPRTGGRTYHACFLKPLFPLHLRCPRSYDLLRMDPTHPSCRLLATHNDYSLLSRLPSLNTSVISSMRDPVDRIVSAYEFAVEIAARSLRWRNVKRADVSLLQARREIRKKLMGRKAETRRVWPWAFLIPLLENDLWSKRESAAVPPDPPEVLHLSPYEKGHVIMTLRDFINHPAAMELLHNGATFQVAGITQNSLIPDAAFLRYCAHRFPLSAGQLILSLAKARLSRMLHVGLTEAHEESSVLFAAVIGRSLHSPAHISTAGRPIDTSAFKMPAGPERDRLMAGLEQANSRAQKQAQAQPARSLLESYHACVASQRNKEASRRAATFKLLGLNFTRETRRSIPPSLLAAIRQLNQLDSELIDFARQVFKRRQFAYSDYIRAVSAPPGTVIGTATATEDEAATLTAETLPLSNEGHPHTLAHAQAEAQEGTGEASPSPSLRRRSLMLQQHPLGIQPALLLQQNDEIVRNRSAHIEGEGEIEEPPVMKLQQAENEEDNDISTEGEDFYNNDAYRHGSHDGSLVDSFVCRLGCPPLLNISHTVA